MTYRNQYGPVRPPSERFWLYVDTTAGMLACWPWTGARLATGYGAFRVNRRTVPASRFALAMALGRELGPGEQACHTCDNRICVNAVHLFLGDARANALDMVAKGRDAARVHPERVLRGEANGLSRLTETIVLAIRARRAEGTSYPALAREFGIATSHAQRVVKGVSWAHVPEETH